MLFTSKSVADCFNTTPRAPKRMARTTSRSSSAAVNTITRVGMVSKFTSSSTAKPSLSGMRKSSSKISGFSFASSLIHSAPFCASPTMVMSSSPSSNLRSPSRKIAWSSAINTRICIFVFAIECQPSGISIVKRAPCPGFDSTVKTPPTVRVRSLMEIGPSRRRSSSSPVNRPAKLKPSPLSSTTKTKRLSSCDSFTTTWEAFACFFMLLSASVNLEELAADAIGGMQLDRFEYEVQGQFRFVAVALPETGHQVHQVGALHPDRAHIGNHAAELGGLALNGALQAQETGLGLLRGGCGLPAQHVHLNLDAEQRLQDAVVEVAGDAAAFGFDGAGAHMAQQKDVFQRGANMA